MSGSPISHARREGYDDFEQQAKKRARSNWINHRLAELVIEAFDSRATGEFVREGECNTEMYLLYCEIRNKKPHTSHDI